MIQTLKNIVMLKIFLVTNVSVQLLCRERLLMCEFMVRQAHHEQRQTNYGHRETTHKQEQIQQERIQAHHKSRQVITLFNEQKVCM